MVVQSMHAEEEGWARARKWPSWEQALLVWLPPSLISNLCFDIILSMQINTSLSNNSDAVQFVSQWAKHPAATVLCLLCLISLALSCEGHASGSNNVCYQPVGDTDSNTCASCCHFVMKCFKIYLVLHATVAGPAWLANL